MKEISYNDEMISARQATDVYAWTFGELMNLADRGLIRRASRQGINGGITYTFRRGDIMKLNAEAGDVK